MQKFEKNIFSVSEINLKIKNVLESDFILFNVSVEGQVSTFKTSGNHAYFILKDDFGSAISCTFFNFFSEKIEIEDGDKIIVDGRVDFYVKGGKLNLNVFAVRKSGIGEMHKQFLQVKQNLQKEGLFEQSHKKQIPEYAKKIGVVTSATGAVVQDIINVTKRRNPFINLVICPARVQGENAEFEIIESLNYFELTDVDVVIVARGGGSFEDLAPFNTEILARRIYDCKKPIISAVGHQTDFSLCDFVSDLRAPTPSAAAEIAVKDVFAIYGEIQYLIETLYGEVENKFMSVANSVKSCVSDALFITQNKIENNMNAIKEKLFKISSSVSLKFQSSLNEIKNNSVVVRHCVSQTYLKKSLEAEKICGNLDIVNPLKLLQRGFATVNLYDKQINSVEKISIGDNIKVVLSDGALTSKVLTIEKK